MTADPMARAREMLWEAMTREMATWPRGFDPENDVAPNRPQDWAAYRGDWVANAACDALATLLTREAEVRGEGWLPIETAPRDGTVIDVWREQGGRETVSWGLRPHDCGEMGQYCDSDWHREKKPGWVCATFGEFIGGKHNLFTHWRPLPAPPAIRGAERG